LTKYDIGWQNLQAGLWRSEEMVSDFDFKFGHRGHLKGKGNRGLIALCLVLVTLLLALAIIAGMEPAWVNQLVHFVLSGAK
jgi:hypothetical protein